MSNNKQQQKPAASFKAKTRYDEKTIAAFCKVQYAAFQTKKQLIILAISLGMILFGVSSMAGKVLSIILVPLGCFILMYLSYIPKNDAEKLVEACNGKFPTSIYAFSEKGFDISSGKDKNYIEYDSIIRLIEDDEYLYFFATPQVAYIVEKKSVEPGSVKRFMDYTQKRVGVEWTETKPWYFLNIPTVMKGRANTKIIKKPKKNKKRM